MKIKPVFKNLYSRHLKRTKVFLLAGLMGGMYSCKDVFEPEMPEKGRTQQIANAFYTDTVTQNLPNDKFMQHLSDINDASFSVFGEDVLRPVTDENGYVNQFLCNTAYSGCSDFDEHINYMCYTGITVSSKLANRIDDRSVDSVATIDAGKVYEFRVDGCFQDPREDWSIHEVNEDVYNSVFRNMSDSALAQMAWNRLTEVNADLGHRQSIYDAILAGYGRWEYRQEIVPIMSKGAKIGLKHSDIGLVQGTTPIQGEPEKCEHFPYSGGVESKRAFAPSEYSRFKGKAYAVINDNYYNRVDENENHYSNGTTAMRIISTDSAGATFSHGIYADTLVMPFKDWYKLTIITNNANNQIEVHAENYQSDFSEAHWGLQNKNNTNMPLGTDTTYFGYPLCFAEQNTNNSEFSVGFTAPEYYGRTTEIATGLENVYCAPARRSSARRAPSDSNPANEVVLHGMIEEKNAESEIRKTGRGIFFVFGGLNQKQK